MYNFDYVKASSVADATAALGGDAQALSGGQTLIPTLKARLGMPSSLVDLSGIEEMSNITNNGDSVTIDTAVEIANSVAIDIAIAVGTPEYTFTPPH